jgi:hypothetical protein
LNESLEKSEAEKAKLEKEKEDMSNSSEEKYLNMKKSKDTTI